MRIIDNVTELFGDDLRGELEPGRHVAVSAASFSIHAFAALESALAGIESFEFIFTGPSFSTDRGSDRSSHREFIIPPAMKRRDLAGTPFEIRLRNRMTARALARDCAAWIRKRATFKSNPGAAIPSFLCTSGPGGEGAAYTGLNGFTAADLGYQPGNLTMINKTVEPALVARYRALFDQLWNEGGRLSDVTEPLCRQLEQVYAENAPARIYHLMLSVIFRSFLEDVDEDLLPNERTGFRDTRVWNTLYKFQQDAALGLINKLETYNGCILADSVGLGKTFTALAVIKYYELRNKSVLVLCPKKLADNWLTYNRNLTTNILAEDRLNYDVLAHTDLLRTSGHSMGVPLDQVNWGNYDLVVIDESHNFRNDEATRSQGDADTRYRALLNRVVRAGVRTKVLMLSATPVNNSFADLRNQLALAYEGNSRNLSDKLSSGQSVEEIFRQAQRAFNEWQDLPAAERTPAAVLERLDFAFFELLDSVTIARSRRHITTHYDMAEIGSFPQRLKPLSYRCALTAREDVPGFNAIYDELSKLTLAVYAPITYVLDSRAARYGELYDTETSTNRLRQQDRETSIRALMRVNLLKRLESSVESFRLTLSRLSETHRQTLDAIARFERSGGDGGVAGAAADPDLDVDMEEAGLERGRVRVAFADMDLISYKRDLGADAALIDALHAEMRKVAPGDDEKLQHLIRFVEDKRRAPINAGNFKLLIFTAFADTAEYLYRELAPLLQRGDGRHAAIVTGSGNPRTTLGHGFDFNAVLTLFSPLAKRKILLPRLRDEARDIDVLIATDCISEGQNLQDCDTVVNYDIHWNPVRIIQRFGRVDRIGSRNERIQLVSYWPDIDLDDYINLKDRVEGRMVIADLTATGDDNPLTARENDVEYRREQLRRLQEEVIDLDDVRQGLSITDLGLNDFRMDLVGWVREHGSLDDAPLGMHAIVAAGENLPPGVIFCLRNLDAAPELARHNRLHPFYLVYVREDGRTLVRHTDPKQALDLLRGAAKSRTAPDPALYEPFNRATDDGRRMERYSDLLNDAVRSMIEEKQGRDIDSLFAAGPTTALVGEVAGLEDFELIAFVVVRAAGE
ncbi:MAG TPA: helicase-related protein [Allosphingosinicella sp.]|jgi:superfamily II DNA or RNA helicase|nr:helicase-related protein [Allosphingosinicella sp.]